MSTKLHANPELLKILLEEQGYVCKTGLIYIYDSEIAGKLERERNALLEKRNDRHGTNVNCCGMNQAIDQLNADLIYLAVLEKEYGKLEEFDVKVKAILLPLEECEPYVFWNDLCKCVQIAEKMPDGFSEETEHFVWQRVNEVNIKVYAEIMNREICLIG